MNSPRSQVRRLFALAAATGVGFAVMMLPGSAQASQSGPLSEQSPVIVEGSSDAWAPAVDWDGGKPSIVVCEDTDPNFNKFMSWLAAGPEERKLFETGPSTGGEQGSGNSTSSGCESMMIPGLVVLDEDSGADLVVLDDVVLEEDSGPVWAMPYDGTTPDRD